MKTIDYLVWWPDEGESESDAISIEYSRYGEQDFEDESQEVAVEAAEYDYENRCGWERSDQYQIICVMCPETKKTANYKVLREFDPTFSVYDIL